MSTVRITVAIPVLNEAKWIEETLLAILAQGEDTPAFEALVMDGGSTDGTLEKVRRMAGSEPRIRLIPNPARIQSAALNIALDQARGEFFVRVDARTRIADDYLVRCIELLETGRAENVGGRMVPRGTTPMGEAIALATSSRFGMGNSYFHYAKEEREVDTVYLGAWRRDTLRALGGFDEEAHANEDYELNIRLREAGGRILLSPKIRSVYLPREDWPGLRRQYSRYGRWKAWTLWKHPSSLRVRQAVPPLFLLTLVLGILLSPFAPLAAAATAALAALYAGVVLLAAALTAFPSEPRHFLRLLLVFPTIHLCWGAGLWSEIVRIASRRRVPPRRSPARAR